MMPDREIAFVKIQPRARGSFMVTIPKEAVELLGIIDNERAKVYVDKEKRRLTYIIDDKII